MLRFNNSRILLWAAAFVAVSAHLCLAEPDPEDAGKDFLSRLYAVPTGRMLPTGAVSLAFGGAFATQGGGEWLGLFSVGLGGIAEFEFSTTHILSNIFSFSEPIGTTALKFRLLDRNSAGRGFDCSMALRSNRWSSVDISSDAYPARLGMKIPVSTTSILKPI
ncbi:MAG: hypothetical protein FJY65_00785 [Calditrichaeota bacterium]|nr:hypothetical protein [Calditrichota bacterium]